MPIFLQKVLQYHNISLHTRQTKLVKIRKLKFKKFQLKPNLKVNLQSTSHLITVEQKGTQGGW